MNNLNELRDFFHSRLSSSNPSIVAPKVVILENLHQVARLLYLFYFVTDDPAK
jgi:hypothetical protein